MKKAKEPTAKVETGRTGVMLRFDDEVVNGIRKLADASGISVNQLMQGLARWAIKNGRPGEPYNDSCGRLMERTQAGCVWFGRPATPPPTLEEQEEYLAHFGGKREDIDHWTDGQLLLALDFTERHVVRDDKDFKVQQPTSIKNKKTLPHRNE